MVRCPNCGIELLGTEKHCRNCGAQLIPGESYNSLSSDRYVTMDSAAMSQGFQTPSSIPVGGPAGGVPFAYTGATTQGAGLSARPRIPLKLIVAAAALVVFGLVLFLFLRGCNRDTVPERGVFQSSDGALELIIAGNEGAITSYSEGALIKRRRCHLKDNGEISVSLIVDYSGGQMSAAYAPRNDSEQIYGTATYAADGNSLSIKLNDGSQRTVTLSRTSQGSGKIEWSQAEEEFQEARESYLAE